MNPILPRCVVLFASFAFVQLVAAGAATAQQPNAAPLAFSPSLLPPLEDCTRAFASQDLARLSWTELVDRLAKNDVVFLGETHIDDTTHRVELAVLEGLLAKTGGKVVLSMEMFERDVQSVLDDYLTGRIDEAAFLHRSRPWGNYEVDYRPLVEACKAAKVPVIAANFPAGLRRRLGQGGKEAFAALSAEERALLPATIEPASDAYWERVGRAVRGHMGGVPESKDERLFDGQNLWDNAMGDAVAKAVAAHPGHVVLHIAGGFHTAFHDGTVAQFRKRNQQSKAVTVQIATTPRLMAARPDLDREQADYLVYGETLARSENDDTFAVEVPAELRYRLFVPESKESPLLVVLPESSVRAVDALDYWRAAFADAIAIAVVEQPFPEKQPDLGMGGRYAIGDGFRSDYSRVLHGVERLVEYVTRRHSIAASRTVVVGDGDGGAAVLWAALYGQWFAGTMVAFDPTDLTRLSREGLPDQKPVVGKLVIAGAQVPAARLEATAGDYRKVGAAVDVQAWDGKAAARHTIVATALGVILPSAPDAAAIELLLQKDLPRARQWAELYAATLQQHGKAARVVVDGEAAGSGERRRLAIGKDGAWPVSTFTEGLGLPLAGGPFGGTTVLYVGASVSDEDRAAFRELEQKKVLKRRNPFANIAVAGPGIVSLPDLMADFKKRGRSRVLIVPAEFCADAATMRALTEELGAAGDGMDISWLPGLGAELAKLAK